LYPLPPNKAATSLQKKKEFAHSSNVGFNLR
jgi:hypothetical protein